MTIYKIRRKCFNIIIYVIYYEKSTYKYNIPHTLPEAVVMNEVNQCHSIIISFYYLKHIFFRTHS